MTRQDYTYFDLSYAPISCWYVVRNGFLKVGIKTKLPAGQVNSFLNDALKEGIEQYNLTHSLTQADDTGEIYRL